jgi:membrane-associated phospholipid phosphatase
VGREVAQQILDWRSTDGSDAPGHYTPGSDPGDWQPTPRPNPNAPPAELPGLPALAPQWPSVTPFAMTSGSQFRPAPPPALDSAEYAAAFNEVKDLGRADSTTRTAEQKQIAQFWNDGLGTAFAMGYWNRIAGQVATDQGLNLVQDARLFALLNIAEADAQIACWDAKYTYNLWRPVTAIRAADTDGNPGTEPDATWTPLLVTPNFPSYTSAHSTLSGAGAEVLAALFGDSYHFTVGADGLPGVTRSFDSFEAAAAEAGRSRIYGGIHYQFDNANGQAVGAEVAGFVVNHFLTSRHDGGDEESGDAGRMVGANHTGRNGAFDGHGGAIADVPAAIGAFGPAGGYETSFPAHIGCVPVDSSAPGGGGARDNGLNATAPVVNPTPRDNAPGDVARTDPVTPIAADLATTDRDDVFGDPIRL